MSVNPEPESSAEVQDALEPETEASNAEEDLGDAGTSKGSGFTTPITQL